VIAGRCAVAAYERQVIYLNCTLASPGRTIDYAKFPIGYAQCTVD
jgi:hypothetical protein